ncbi:hypothetical protein BDR05DRAFT_312979 [Suillus weaverae]|nr:hypothetical protein BDR05DRAFT_312979 [Suillus weaverae]
MPSTWSAIVTMLTLTTLDISSAKDDQSKVINFTPTFIAGVVWYLTSPCHSILLSTIVSLLQLSCDLPLQYFGTIHIHPDLVD